MDNSDKVKGGQACSEEHLRSFEMCANHSYKLAARDSLLQSMVCGVDDGEILLKKCDSINSSDS